MAVAGADAFARSRPRLRGLDATTTLQDFAIVTFAVEPGRLATLLPAGLAPEVRRLDDGREVAFVSAVSFREVDFRFAIAPRMRASFFQTNYRAYVHGRDGRRAVFFFGTTLDSGLVVVPRIAWGMPWHGGRTRLESRWQADGRCVAYRHRCTGRWGAADVELEGTGMAAGRLDGFVDADDAALVLTHPLDGYFSRPDSVLGRYAVWHERLRPQLGIARRATYAVFKNLGLVTPAAMPHSVLLQRSVDFDVLLPPRRA
jgi:uncharacterized protein YqjF (DUF2071 family)